jgi:hypothetical protein
MHEKEIGTLAAFIKLRRARIKSAISQNKTGRCISLEGVYKESSQCSLGQNRPNQHYPAVLETAGHEDHPLDAHPTRIQGGRRRQNPDRGDEVSLEQRAQM